MSFESKRLDEVAEIVGGGTPSTKVLEFWDGEVPWLTPKDLSTFEGVYVARGSRSLTEKGFKSSSARMLPAGSVLYTSRAPIGYVAIAQNPISTNQGFKSLILKDGYVPEFVFYLLKASKTEIESHASGGTFAEISARALGEVVLNFPLKDIQEAISKILLNLDEKITINNAISKTLESMAQSIFKSWFIDFDPVYAKSRGEKPFGMDDETAALFPDSFEESELGMIPKGWNVGTLSDLMGLQGGYAFKSSSWQEEGVPVVKIGSVKPGYIDLNQVSYVSDSVAGEISDLYRLPAGSILVGLTGYVGEVGLMHTSFPVPLLNQRVARFVMNNESVQMIYVYCITRDPNFKIQVEKLATGSAQQNVSIAQILSIQTVIPSEDLIGLFCNSQQSILNQLVALMDQNESLKLIRDALLPRLISGELQIPEELLVS